METVLMKTTHKIHFCRVGWMVSSVSKVPLCLGTKDISHGGNILEHCSQVNPALLLPKLRMVLAETSWTHPSPKASARPDFSKQYSYTTRGQRRHLEWFDFTPHFYSCFVPFTDHFWLAGREIMQQGWTSANLISTQFQCHIFEGEQRHRYRKWGVQMYHRMNLYLFQDINHGKLQKCTWKSCLFRLTPKLGLAKCLQPKDSELLGCAIQCMVIFQLASV